MKAVLGISSSLPLPIKGALHSLSPGTSQHTTPHRRAACLAHEHAFALRPTASSRELVHHWQSSSRPSTELQHRSAALHVANAKNSGIDNMATSLLVGNTG
ncbi:hypothetical protein SEVIR_1G076175v4 [Setaria viridis]